MFNMKSSKTFRLFKEHPSFLGGFSSLFDISDTLSSNIRKDNTENDADTKSLRSDWEVVGGDVYSAIDKYGKAVKQ
jgi:hypothetical protein